MVVAAKSVELHNVEPFTPRVRTAPSRPRCAFRSGDSTFYPFIDEVIHIQARRNYSEIYTCASSFTVREVLASLERRLARYGFVRVQRSAIINVAHITEIRREGRGRYAVVLTDRSVVVVSSATKEKLEQLLCAD